VVELRGAPSARRFERQVTEEPVDALEQPVLGDGRDVEALDDQRAVGGEHHPVVAVSVVVASRVDSHHEAGTREVGLHRHDVGEQRVAARVVMQRVAELEVLRHSLVEVRPGAVWIGLVPHREVVIERC
jgi:hypothetical protein